MTGLQYLAPEVKSELDPDEKIVWTGQPSAMIAAMQTIPIFIFGLIWTTFSLFFVYMSFGTTTSGQNLAFFSVIGIPFSLLGLLLISTPFYNYALTRKIYYVVTNRSLYVIELGKKKSVSRYSRSDLINPIRTESGGRGSLCWTLQGQSARPSYRGNKATGEVVFKDIENPRELEKLLRES